jgi:hypothetical protein
MERVAHQDEVFGLGGPGGFGAFVGVDDGRAALGGETDGLLEVFGADLRLDKGRVGGKAESFTPARSQARWMRSGSSSMETLWK